MSIRSTGPRLSCVWWMLRLGVMVPAVHMTTAEHHHRVMMGVHMQWEEESAAAGGKPGSCDCITDCPVVQCVCVRRGVVRQREEGPPPVSQWEGRCRTDRLNPCMHLHLVVGLYNYYRCMIRSIDMATGEWPSPLPLFQWTQHESR